MKLLYCILVLVLFGVGNVHTACVSQQSSSSCSLQLPSSFSVNATVNITFSQGLLTFEQIFGNVVVYTFAFQGPASTPQGATCISNNQMSWCLFFVNYANNGQTASSNMVSTFVEKPTVYTNGQGQFSLHSSANLFDVRVPPPAPPPPSICGKCVPGCYCNPGHGCQCCPSSNIQDTCVSLAGAVDSTYLQATVTFQNIVWMVSSSYVTSPQPICTVSNGDMTGILCLDFVDLNFSQQGISGNVLLMYFKDGNTHDGDTIYLGNFRLA